MDVPERCHRLAVGITAEQLAIVTDTEIHVSFSLFGVGVFGQKMHSSVPPGSWTQRQTEGLVPDSVQNYTRSPLSAQLGSVKKYYYIFWAFAGSNDPTALPPWPLGRRWGTGPYWQELLFDRAVCLDHGLGSLYFVLVIKYTFRHLPYGG